MVALRGSGFRALALGFEGLRLGSICFLGHKGPCSDFRDGRVGEGSGGFGVCKQGFGTFSTVSEF